MNELSARKRALFETSRELMEVLRAKLARQPTRADPPPAPPSLVELVETPRYCRADLRPVRLRSS
jgi:hypothetical protein